MAKKKWNSIITDDGEHCIECGKSPAYPHHVFDGCRRQNSEQEGMVIPLCWECHRRIHIEPSQQLMHRWHVTAQLIWEEKNPNRSFLQVFGKNYIF